MKKLILALGMAVTMLAVSAPAYCGDKDRGHKASHSQKFSFHKPSHHKSKQVRKSLFDKADRMKAKQCKTKPQPPVKSVPEIDGGHAGLALALLASIFGIMRERKIRITK